MAVKTWHRLERSFNIMVSVVGAPTKRINEEINSAWDIYDEYRNHIQSAFTGDEQSEHIAKLHELVLQRIENVTNTYVDEIGNFLAEYGVDGEKNTLRKSMLALFEESVSAKLGMSLADFGISVSDHKSENLYSLDDFYVLGFMMQATYDATAFASSNNRNEFTAQFILFAMEKESIYAAFSINDSLKNKLEIVFSNRINGIIDAKNAEFANMKELAKAYGITPSEEQLARWTDYEKEPIWQLVNNVVESMRSGQSAQTTIEKFDNYFSVFFKNYNNANNVFNITGSFIPEISLAIKLNEFLTHLGQVSQLSVNGVALTA